jgi:predicted amidohydrolase YtcJ
MPAALALAASPREACRDRPLVVVRYDGHTVIANSKAIEAAGVSASTPDPAGGAIDREADGFPAGAFRETATAMLLGTMPLPDLDVLIANAQATFARLAGCGITSAGVILQADNEGPAGAQGTFDLAATQMFLPHVPFPLYSLLISRDTERALAARDTPLHDAVAGHRVGGVKIFADGTLGSRTACMRAPFSDAPGRSGFMTLDEDELYQRMVAAHACGLQIAIHAIGDEANRRCIRLYERLLAEHPRADHRHRLEHASLLDAAMIADLARLRLVVSTQPMFIHSEKGWLHKRLGAERAKDVYPLRALVDAGVKVAGASDAPVESPDVLHAIQCCVTRDGFEPHQCITAEQAVQMYTIDAAFAQFEESAKGSIAVGKRADLVILSANPVAVPPHAIGEIQVERTIVAGRTVFAG